MRQKIDNFRKQIRRQQLTQYFRERRQELTSAHQNSNNKEVYVSIGGKLQPRQRACLNQQNELQIDRLPTQSCQEESITVRWEEYQREIDILRDKEEYQMMTKMLQEIYRDLKRVSSPKNNNLYGKKEEIYHFFHQKTILTQIVDSLVHAFSQNIHGGILQKLSAISISILSLCIHQLHKIYDQQLFLQSNLLLFLRYATCEPKFDIHHLSKIFQIVTHMIIVSTGERGKNLLFQVLNDRTSKFHIGALFFNISKIPIRPREQIQQNFIIMMKYYLLKVEQDISRSKKNNNKPDTLPLSSQSFSCLTLQQIGIVLQIAVNGVNNLTNICFEDTEDINCLQEALEVLRITIQQFKVKQMYKKKLNFRKLIYFLNLKNCISEIKVKILAILDHVIFIDTLGQMGQFLIRQCELLQNLWTLRDDFPDYVMNIMCNLAIDQNLKTFLQKYSHNICLKLKLDENDYMLFTFMYNWLSSQDFEIRTSRDKLMVEHLTCSEQKDQKGIQLQCMLWYQLARHNEVQIPQRVLEQDLPVVQRIKTQILGEPYQPFL